jgi:dTDP-4-amino-4,6-dideoxygalactose transaminase
LAISEGRRRIGVGTADITAEDRARVQQVLESGRLSAGPMMSEFESRFAALHERRHAAMCNSGTGALQLALQALKERYGWADGSEVIVPAMTFVATVNIVLFNRLTPVLADIDPLTLNLNPASAAKAVTDRTVAIIPVHLFGQPADMTSIMALAADHDLRVIEDSCETVAARHSGRMVGTFGDFGCFSTYMAHIVTTGVGGLALTDDDENITRFLSLMNHGRNPVYLRIDDDQGLDDEALLRVVWSRYDFVSMGQSYRATEMEAALGIGQLERLGAKQERRRQVATRLLERLEHPDVQLPHTAEGNEHAYMMFPIVCRTAETRDRLVIALERAGVETRFLLPIIGQPCYDGVLDFPPDAYSNTRHALANGFYIGSHPGMTDDDVDYIADVVHATLGSPGSPA